MAEIIDSLSRPNAENEHPFNEWSDGRARRIKEGEDYKGTSRNMTRQLRRQAARRQLKVTIHPIPGGLEFQFRAR